MKFTKGLHTDANPIDQPEGSYRFAKNLVDNNITLAKENEEGFTLSATLPSLGGDTSIIGVIPVGNASVIFSTDGTESRISLVTGAVVTTIYDDPALNFDKEHPIKGEYRVDVNGNRIVAWQDGINPDRILNIDDQTGVSNVDDLAIDQTFVNPTGAIAISDTGGALLSGAYIAMTKYKGTDGSETPWFIHDRVAYINDDSKALSFQDCDGCDAGTLTNKSISFTFSGGDLKYERIVLGVIQTINGISRVYEVSEKENSSFTTFVYTGSESTTELSIDEVLTPPARYNFSRAITQVKGQLVRGNLTTDPIPDFQPYAIGINIDYTSSLVSLISNTSTHKDVLPPSLMPGEAYAFYIGLNLKKGGWVFYHIPGRIPVGPEVVFVNNATTGLSYYRYQVENTSNTIGATNNLGYWENIGETYPNDPAFDGTAAGNDDLRGLPVRHHRMPTLDYLITNVHTASTVGVTSLPRLDLVASNVIIPTDIQAQINGWKIFYAKKDQTNSIVIGSDLLQFGVNQANNTSVRWSSGGNWTIEAEQSGGGWDNLNMVKDTLRCHALDLLKDRSAITPTYAEFHYTLARNNVNTGWTGFRTAGARMTETGQGRGQVLSAVIDYTVPAQTTRSGVQVVRRLDNFKFLPLNSQDGKFKSQITESCYVADIFNFGTTFADIPTPQAPTNSSGTTHDNFFLTTGIETTKYYHLHRLLQSAHNSFMQQDLIPLTGFATAAQTLLTNIQGGNAFLCYMSYLSLGPMHATSTEELHGVRAWKGYIGYANNNWNYRHEEAGLLGSKYYGKTDPRYLFTPFANSTGGNYVGLVSGLEEQNVIRYNTDYSMMNGFIAPVIFNPDLIQQTEFDTLVIWSITQGEDSEDISWRTFPSGNRYTMPRNRGPITNLQGVRNRDLLIHHKHSLFKTVTDSSLSGDGEDINLKSNEFFDLTPIEVMSTEEGYAGCQHRFAAKLTKAGYVFPDDLQGKVFIYDGDRLKEISAFGNRRFFRDNMDINTIVSSNQDNPFVYYGYTAGFDERYNRIILSKKGTTQFTVSYDPVREQWLSYHSYVPDYMFRQTDNILYGVKGLSIYKHQKGTKGVYYDPTVNPMYLDVVFNSDRQIKKTFTDLVWRTESFNASDVLQYLDTFSHITPMSNEQCAGRVAVVRAADIYDTDANSRILHGTWYFNKLRDIALQPGFRFGFYQDFALDGTKLDSNQDWYETRKIVDNFLICRFEYPNTTNNLLAIYELDSQYRDETR